VCRGREREREKKRALEIEALSWGKYISNSNPILFNHSRKNGGSFPTS